MTRKSNSSKILKILCSDEWRWLRSLCRTIAFVGLFIITLLSCSANTRTDSPPILEGDLSLIINVEGLLCCEGILRVGVYHDKAFWMRDDGMIRGRIGMILSPQQRIEIHGLPPGNYAIAVHQDINGDGKFNRRFGILPKEPYGFSNNVGRYGPASFRAASVTLDRDLEISIQLNSALTKSTAQEE